MSIMLVTRVETLVAAAPPTPKCDLFTNLSKAADNPVGQILGLSNFASWILMILAVGLVIVAFNDRLRSRLLRGILWIIAAVMILLAMPGLISTFSVSTC